ncbi:MAG: LTA synthase family protein [Candidatus Hydrogenedentota bacterium]
MSFALLAAMIVMRILEFAAVAASVKLPGEFPRVLMHAFLGDGAFYLRMLPVLLVPFCLLSLRTASPTIRVRGFLLLATPVMLLQFALVKYFITALTPLGADLYGYSFRDILTTIRTGGGVDLISIALLIVPLASLWFLAARFNRGPIAGPRVALALLAAGVAACGLDAMPDGAAYRRELAWNMAVNKLAFFTVKSRDYFLRGAGASGAEGTITAGKDGFKYLDPEYPFLRADETSDALGTYFRIDPAHPPNFVFLSVEGLGRAFSGPRASLGSFTPFLDELGAKSLTWENFLAAQGRTFAALPSMFGSLPFGEKGFNDLGERMPPHHSLLSVLKVNGYRSAFIGGFDLDFDNQRAFLKRQGLDLMVGMNDMDSKFARSPGRASSGASWGYADREVLMKALDVDARDKRQPFVTVIQTMSMHTPYAVPGQSEYFRRVDERIAKLRLSSSEKEERNNSKHIFSTILYTDDALREYFGAFEKRPAYANTIFIITGDHRLPEIPMSTRIDRYHVPLIIFSPLLKRAVSFKSISSHLDLAPSLTAFLRNNYGLRVPTAVPWVGSGLDTSIAFRNVHRYPMKQTIGDLRHYISGLYFLDEDVLYDVKDRMNIEPVEDEAKRKELLAEFDEYKARNALFARDLKLVPDRFMNEYR